MADLRTSTINVGVLADWDPMFRVSTFYVEVALDADPLLRCTQYHLEVLYSASEATEEAQAVEPMSTPVFPEYAPVEYGEKWGHSS